MCIRDRVSIENRNSVEYKDVMTINSDGTGSSAIYENGQIDKDGVDNFRYNYDENSKVFTWIWEEDSAGSDVYSMHVRELTGSKLVLVDDMDDEGEGEVITCLLYTSSRRYTCIPTYYGYGKQNPIP